MNEFEKWLIENQDHLKTYTNQEIYDLAVACGLDRRQVSTWFTTLKFKAA